MSENSEFDNKEGSNDGPKEAEKKKGFYWYIDGAILCTLAAAATATVFAAAIFLFAAAKEFVFVAKTVILEDHSIEGVKSALETSIHGLEFILLALLPYFLIRSFTRYLTDLKKKGKVTPDAKSALISVKALITSLLARIVTADFVGDVLGGTELTSPESLIQILLLVVLCAYFFVLEHIAEKIKKSDS